jgi:putative ABC transport system permease protein
MPGVARADPLVILHSTVRRPAVRDVNMIAARPGGLGTPPLAGGRPVARAGEVVADTELGLALGDRLELSGRRLEVVGLADRVTWYFGTPTLFLALEDAQAVAFGGQPLAMAVLTRGVPGGGVPGLERFTNGQAVADLERPLVRGLQSIDLISGLLWLVAAGIIGSIVYLSVLERLRELAVLAVGIATLLAPVFPFSVEIPPLAFPRLVATAMLVGLAASVVGLRRAVAVQPALAFGGP